MPISYRIYGDACQAKYYKEQIWRDNRRIGYDVNGCQPINQWFGETAFDYTQFGMLGHNGIDFSAMNGACLYSMLTAKVIWVKSVDDGYGENIATVTNLGTVQLEAIYGHLQEEFVVEGQDVPKGKLLGLCDNTGYPKVSTGAHLHAAIRPLFPLGSKNNLREHWKIKGWGWEDNGYQGYVDFRDALGEEQYKVNREVNNVDKRYFKSYNPIAEITAKNQLKKYLKRNPNNQEIKAVAYGKYYPSDLEKTDMWLYGTYISHYNSGVFEH